VFEPFGKQVWADSDILIQESPYLKRLLENDLQPMENT